jgi:hypothetical protein
MKPIFAWKKINKKPSPTTIDWTQMMFSVGYVNSPERYACVKYKLKKRKEGK